MQKCSSFASFVSFSSLLLTALIHGNFRLEPMEHLEIKKIVSSNCSSSTNAVESYRLENFPHEYLKKIIESFSSFFNKNCISAFLHLKKRKDQKDSIASSSSTAVCSCRVDSSTKQKRKQRIRRERNRNSKRRQTR